MSAARQGRTFLTNFIVEGALTVTLTQKFAVILPARLSANNSAEVVLIQEQLR